MGRPKNGKTWKYTSARALTHKKYCPSTWKEKMEDKHRMKALRLRIKEKDDAERAEVYHFAFNPSPEKSIQRQAEGKEEKPRGQHCKESAVPSGKLVRVFNPF
jgi:hypothetical protein